MDSRAVLAATERASWGAVRCTNGHRGVEARLAPAEADLSGRINWLSELISDSRLLSLQTYALMPLYLDARPAAKVSKIGSPLTLRAHPDLSFLFTQGFCQNPSPFISVPRMVRNLLELG